MYNHTEKEVESLWGSSIHRHYFDMTVSSVGTKLPRINSVTLSMVNWMDQSSNGNKRWIKKIQHLYLWELWAA